MLGGGRGRLKYYPKSDYIIYTDVGTKEQLDFPYQTESQVNATLIPQLYREPMRGYNATWYFTVSSRTNPEVQILLL
jgi:hypothetical protein